MNRTTAKNTTTPPTSPPPGAAVATDLVSRYKPIGGATDTMVGANGTILPAWLGLAPRMREVTADDLARREHQIARLIEDQGVPPSGADGEGNAAPRRAALDPIPFLMDTPGFEALAGALSQRARLLNRLVTDLLTEQACLREKILPPALLFANPRYQRAYHGLPVFGGRFVHVHASDVGIGPDGRWWSLGDHTQAPPGLGLMLENRVISARVHADWFGDLNVSRLTGALEILRETLSALAPRDRRNPRVVVLGHDPETAAGIEDEYLARYLGYTFAVGEDLATREGQTVLKTLGGAVPVEVVLRRIADDRVDPVELSPDATEGIAGLVDSQRREEVSIANMLGAQLGEAPGLMAFLDPLSRFYFGEDLRLPSAPTWWCGHAPALDHALANLDKLTVRSAFDAAAAPVSGAGLTAAEREDLAARIRATPERFVAQEPVGLGTTPAWNGQAITPERWSMRAFALLEGDEYVPAPGGVVRLGGEGRETGGYGGRGSEARVQDCWVLSQSEVSEPTLQAAPEERIVITRSGSEMPSRVAEKLYWLGRRIEAFEHMARLLRSLLTRATDDLPMDPPEGQLHPWLGLFTLVPGAESPTFETAPEVVRASIGGPSRPEGLGWLLGESVRFARAVRDRVPHDAWQLLTQTERRLHGAPGIGVGGRRSGMVDVSTFLDELILDASAFSGLVNENMTRSLAWQFLDMGRRVQRALDASKLLGAGLSVPTANERQTLAVLLDVCDSTMTYRSRYRSDVRVPSVLDLLLVDESNPRSVAFQLSGIVEHLGSLPRSNVSAPLDADQRTALGLLDAVRLADWEELASVDETGSRALLGSLTGRITDGLPIAERAFSARFLVHADLPKQFTAVGPTGPEEGSVAE
ncbi:MAG: hypothetical protein CMJ31_06680 [Phycisphaerae bacterium]|nr:hypothetical protein [Phycisphaerae bacterium]